jgi:hypothetical protein
MAPSHVTYEGFFPRSLNHSYTVVKPLLTMLAHCKSPHEISLAPTCSHSLLTTSGWEWLHNTVSTGSSKLHSPTIIFQIDTNQYSLSTHNVQLSMKQNYNMNSFPHTWILKFQGKHA